MTSESDLLTWRARRRAITSVSRLRVKLTRLGLRNDLGLPMIIIAHFMRENQPGQTFLSQLQRSQREERKNQRGDPEARNYFRLFPPLQFKVMMNRRHSKHPLAPELERNYLDYH